MTADAVEKNDAVWLRLDRTEKQCERRSFMRLGQICGARKVKVSLSPYAKILAIHFNVEVKDGDEICCSDRSECGMITGLKLKNLLGALQ